MDDYVIETDDSEEFDEPEESEFPWKAVMAAFVAGATSVGTIVAVKKLRRRKTEQAAQFEEDVINPTTIIPPTA